MTGKVINLNRVRKTQLRVEKRDKADQNAVTFGTPKGLKALQKARNQKAARALDLHKRDD